MFALRFCTAARPRKDTELGTLVPNVDENTSTQDPGNCLSAAPHIKTAKTNTAKPQHNIQNAGMLSLSQRGAHTRTKKRRNPFSPTPFPSPSVFLLLRPEHLVPRHGESRIALHGARGHLPLSGNLASLPRHGEAAALHGARGHLLPLIAATSRMGGMLQRARAAAPLLARCARAEAFG